MGRSNIESLINCAGYTFLYLYMGQIGISREEEGRKGGRKTGGKEGKTEGGTEGRKRHNNGAK